MLPQEIELWYVIPALRKELALALKKQGLTQKKVAEILQVSPAAISQYFKEKRAKNVPFTTATKSLINKSASKLINNPLLFSKEIINLTNSIRTSGFICSIHELFESDIKPSCQDCFAEGLDG